MVAGRSYRDAIAALNSLQSNYATVMAIRQSGNLVKNHRSSLMDMRDWTRKMGYSVSDLNRLNVVHITGTKGKGSTAAFTNSILQQYHNELPKIGLFTSPHLKTIRERIRINGEPLSEEKFTNYFFQVWDKLRGASVKPFPAYFKYLTLLSFHVFMQEGCHACVYEVGVGGEYDSTNIIERPRACGVSLLGIDHTFMLGDTIQDIAWNKSGIFKNGAPAFTIINQPKRGLEVLQQRAKEKHTTLTQVPIFKKLQNIQLGIDGHFQISNASLAIALASSSLHSMGLLPTGPIVDQDSDIPKEFIKGLQNTQWPGRCQTMKMGRQTWYIDGAHTKESIQAATSWFLSKTKMQSPKQKLQRKRILLFNQQTRDATPLLKALHSIAYPEIQFDTAIFVTNVTWSSGKYSQDLISMNTSKENVDTLQVQKKLAAEWAVIDPIAQTHTASDIETATNLIKELYDEPVDIFVTGSLHLVGGLLVVFDGKE